MSHKDFRERKLTKNPLDLRLLILASKGEHDEVSPMDMLSCVRWRTISAPEDVSDLVPVSSAALVLCVSQPFGKCGAVSQVALIYSSLMAADVEHNSVCLFAVQLLY